MDLCKSDEFMQALSVSVSAGRLFPSAVQCRVISDPCVLPSGCVRGILLPRHGLKVNEMPRCIVVPCRHRRFSWMVHARSDVLGMLVIVVLVDERLIFCTYVDRRSRVSYSVLSRVLV